MVTMSFLLYVYDCKKTRQSNARRVAFTKELYGFTYSWKTRSGNKVKRRSGLIDSCPGARSVSDSVILVPESSRMVFDRLFKDYQDIAKVVVFRVMESIENSADMLEHVF